MGGVAFGVYRIARPLPNPLLENLAEGEAALTPFVKITGDAVTLIVPRADVGQGIASLQAYMIAEELDVDPLQVILDPGQPDAVYHNATVAADGLPFPLYDDGVLASAVRGSVGVVTRAMSMQFTGGSSSTADMQETLRRAGAMARETLKQAASIRSGIARAELSTDNGAVVLPDGTRIAYTELAAEAAQLDPVEQVQLRSPEQWRWLGKSMQRTDIVAKSTGRQMYGIDVRLPDMLYATVRLNPGIGASVRSYDDVQASAMKGVQSVVSVSGGIGVIADNTWRAFRAAAAVEIDWNKPDYPASQAEMWAALEAAHNDAHRNNRLRDNGDVDASVSVLNAIEAEYRVPFLAHAALEPLSATVLYKSDSLEIWTATQVPKVLRDQAAKLSGVDTADVLLHLTHAGGSFGRRLDADYVMPAIELAMTMPGVPIQTTLSREEDMTHDFPRPIQMARCRGTVSEDGVQSFDLDTIGPSVSESWFGRILFTPPGPDPLLVAGAYDQPYAIANYRVTGYRAPPMAPIGSWRSPGACSNTFFHDTFLDELIHASGADPLQERLRLIDHEDSRRVLETVGQMCNWQGRSIGEQRGRGIAFAYAHGVPVAAVIDVSVTESGVTMDEVWVTADCGTVFDVVNAEAQVTGSVIWGLAHAMNCELTYENYAPVQTNFDRFRGMRINQAPAITVKLLGQAKKVRGLGEPAMNVAAPALGNAIFAATGKRIRELPFSSGVGFV